MKSPTASTFSRRALRHPRWLGAAVVAGLFVAVAPGCGGGGSADDPTPPAAGGSAGQAGAAGSGVGGVAGAAGDAGPGKGGSAGQGTGGSAGQATGGSAGTAAGGSAGNQGGSAGTAGDAGDAGCTGDNACAGNATGKFCDLGTGKCVECKAGDPNTCQVGLYCDAATQTCQAGCDTQDDCDLNNDAGVMVCDPTTHKCVGCVNDTQCPLGNICKGGSCEAGCTDQHGCEAGLTCCGGGCVNIDSDTDHCGACNSPCKIQNGLGHCGGGKCSLDGCNPPFVDCDKSAANGCELDGSSQSCECTPGEVVECFNGLPEWKGVGICVAGSMLCNAAGTAFGPCTGEVLPAGETCSNQLDDDCDGLVNEDGPGCLCVPNATAPCYTGPAGTRNTGICTDGTWTCNAQGTAYGPCTGQVLPGAETCLTPVDDDCDGEVNEAGGAGCQCAPNSQKSCYSGPPGTDGVGVCETGVQICDALGQGFGPCTGDVVPSPDVCTDNLDNDCNGTVNDGLGAGAAGCVCFPGELKVCYSGPAGTAGVGACKTGLSACNAAGDGWGPCANEVVPSVDNCTDTLDNDCNGVVNDGFASGGTACVCEPNTLQNCYEGPAGTLNIGLCKAGKNTCSADGKSWGPCFGQTIPDLDSCLDSFDNDCNGKVNDGDHNAPGCACIPGSMKCVDNHEIYCNAVGDWGAPQGLCNQICKAGQYNCDGNQVLQCDVGPPAKWVPRVGSQYICSAPAHTKCNATTGTCTVPAVTGTAAETGVYYQYATFNSSNSVFKGGYDVDAFGDFIYVNRGTYLDKYKVTLLDSDGDGKLEPNQHPNNAILADKGPMEARILTLVQSWPKSGNVPPLGSQSIAEIYAENDRIYVLGPSHNGSISEWVFGAATAPVVAPSTASFGLSMLGRGPADGLWYAGLEDSSTRWVYSYHAASKSWVTEFGFPSLAGGHFDGLESVVAPATGVQYIYVSDMTSDYIGQYRRDGMGGWVKENIFRYNDAISRYVEGMGFGSLNHFWATSGDYLYEIGGGDMSAYLE